MKKIAFIGAGSFGFTRGLVKDILSFPALSDCHLALMDINDERLAAIEKAGEQDRWPMVKYPQRLRTKKQSVSARRCGRC